MSQTDTNPVRQRPRKSLATAVALAFFLGPIGLLYSSLIGAAVMLIVSMIVLVPILLGLYINATIYFPVWVVCVVWAAFAAHERNQAWPEEPLEHDAAAPLPSESAPVSGPPGGAPGRS